MTMNDLNNVTLILYEFLQRIVFKATATQFLANVTQCSISHSISVCPSNAGTVIKQIKLRSCGFHRGIALSSQFLARLPREGSSQNLDCRRHHNEKVDMPLGLGCQ